MASSKAELVPHELLLRFQHFLPLLEKHLVVDAWRKWHPTKEEEHSAAWGGIFKDNHWLSATVDKGLNPALVGCDLHRYVRRRFFHIKNQPTNLALVLGFDGEGGRDKPDIDGLWTVFWSSLREHTVKDGELFFPETGLTLNFRDAVYNYYNTHIHTPRKLVHRSLTGFHSAYLYWKDDEYKIREIGPKNVVGVIEWGLKRVDRALGLEWNHIPSNISRQHYFVANDGAELKLEPLHRTDRYGITGWKWNDEAEYFKYPRNRPN